VASPNTRRAYAGVLDRLPAELSPGRQLAAAPGDEIAAALRRLWGGSTPATWNRNRAALVSWLNCAEPVPGPCWSDDGGRGSGDVGAVPVGRDPGDAAGRGTADVDANRAVVARQASYAERPVAIDRVDRSFQVPRFPARQAVRFKGETPWASAERCQEHARRQHAERKRGVNGYDDRAVLKSAFEGRLRRPRRYLC
jgi:hypothetical protein